MKWACWEIAPCPLFRDRAHLQTGLLMEPSVACLSSMKWSSWEILVMSLILILCNGPRLGVMLSTQCSTLSFLGIFEKWLGGGLWGMSLGLLMCLEVVCCVQYGCVLGLYWCWCKGCKVFGQNDPLFHGGGDGGDRPTAHSLSDPSTFPLSIRLGVWRTHK